MGGITPCHTGDDNLSEISQSSLYLNALLNLHLFLRLDNYLWNINFKISVFRNMIEAE